mmetsp:Transcript_235/g.589  ORF Transcript_235/g.589 Transcript_235/m.589 type:complete len:92 (-) Transcript_235:178-453(-)
MDPASRLSTKQLSHPSIDPPIHTKALNELGFVPVGQISRSLFLLSQARGAPTAGRKEVSQPGGGQQDGWLERVKEKHGWTDGYSYKCFSFL